MLSLLVPNYVAHKKEYDVYKKIVDNENGQIKNIMEQAKLDTFSDGEGSGVSYSKRESKSMNQEGMVSYLQNDKYHDIFCGAGVLITKEVIDEDALEKLLYNIDKQPKVIQDALKGLDKFITVKTTPTLRVI